MAMWNLVGGLENEFYFPFHIWDVIFPIDPYSIFQDGYCTTNQKMDKCSAVRRFSDRHFFTGRSGRCQEVCWPRSGQDLHLGPGAVVFFNEFNELTTRVDRLRVSLRLVVPQFGIAKLVQRSPISPGFIGVISILNGAYKPTYNCGGATLYGYGISMY